MSPRLVPGGWDLAYDGGLVVELDEELHFNRYRSATLRQDWCTALPWRDDYLALCQSFEPECIRAGKWGRRWTNSSTERMFAPADPPGHFGPHGAPRWKQRALYDAVKDLWSLWNDTVSLARVATHDVVADVPLQFGLDGLTKVPDGEILDLVERRTSGGATRNFS